MLYKRAIKWLGILFSSVFIISFLFSYNLSSRGFFDFEQYLKDLRAMAIEAREKVSGSDSEANGEDDLASEGEVDEDGETSSGDEDADRDQGSGGSEIAFTDRVVYENLSEYRGQNPYTSFLTDRALIMDMRYLIGAEYYKHLIKSMPNAEVVYYDEESKLYTVTGSNEVLMDSLSGIVQIKDTGQVYIAYIRDGNIHYHTNDREYSGELIQNRYMNRWIEENRNDRDIIYFNKDR